MRRSWRRASTPIATRFVQHYGTTEVDASLLYFGSVGFLPGDDPKVLGTIRAIEQDLIRDGLVLRYRTQSGVDGLEGDEHPFLACSFWLVGAYARAGRVDDAEELMDSPDRADERRRAACRRSTTRSATGWSATFRRRSRI